MPCDDVTEEIEVILDEADRLTGYRLLKRSCGRAVGEQSLLLEEFAGRQAEDLIGIGADDFADQTPDLADEELFLRLKHLFALQGSLRALTGIDPAGIDSPVRAGRIGWEDDRLVFEAEIVVDVITEKIKSCGKCAGCGSIAKKLAAAGAG